MNNDIKSELVSFINNAEAYWDCLGEDTPKNANSKNRENKKIVDKWTKSGVLIEVLLPLLIHSSNAVKFAAAANLIKSEAKDEAIPVLRNLIERDPGLISPMAAAVLRVNKISKLSLH
jgi:hypothetical protein